MKTWMKVVLGIAAAITGLLALVFWLTGDVVEAGDQFFAEVQAENIDGAYELLSEDFQATTSKQDLQAYLQDNALTTVEETSWGSRSIENNRATLTGSVTTEKGGVIPLTLKMVNTETGWKIYKIEKASAGISEGSGLQPLPPIEKQKELAQATTVAFVDGANAGDMTGFHKNVSRMLRNQHSVDSLNTAFRSMMDLKNPLDIFKEMKPVFVDGAEQDEDGVMIIRGYYDSKPERYEFRYKYVYEGLSWKLLGLTNRIAFSSGEFQPF